MERDRFVEGYLDRLRFTDPPAPDAETLRMLHRRHLLHLPFENLDIMDGRRIELNEDALWDKLIARRRGGICYELNGLFCLLLRHLGFEADYLAAQVMEDGTEFDHVLLLVQADGEQYLADVGFGDHFLEPLRFQPDLVQRDANGDFRLLLDGDGRCSLHKAGNGSEWNLEYAFRLQSRYLEEYRERCLAFETAADSRFRRTRLCSLERDKGRISLTEKKLIVTEKGERTETLLDSEEAYRSALWAYFGIRLQERKVDMDESNAAIETIDAYIASFPPDVQERLREMRRTIREAAPDAVEAIRYRMPTFVLNGNLVHFAAFRRHIGFYPDPEGIEAFRDELSAYQGAKGSVQFPLDRPIPYDLVRRITEYRAEQNRAKPKRSGRKA
ncbi:arylamine N-acetyltransferase [Gorillibacterium sp. sgz500922]|uniref:arylamine N-acetyltransferase n=1 Tax=Gorillibacterium sp. sgz500922 TaxID=3446694 RepID=UPI003F66318F